MMKTKVANKTLSVTNWLKKINTKIRENRFVTVKELLFDFPQIFKKLGYHKCSTRWIPKLLSQEQKNKGIEASLKFLDAYNENSDSLLDQIVNGLVTKLG